MSPARPVACVLQLVDILGSYGKDAAESRRLDQKEVARASVRKAKYGSLSSFTLVETTGLAWTWKLLRDTLRYGTPPGSASEPERRLVHRVGGDPVTDREKAGLLATMLRGMSLTRHFAPLVVFVGHGSHTENNPNAAGLNCGACGGQSGGVNARLAAELFNDPHVRAFLAEEEGIRVPDYAWAIAAEHCTVTDEVTIAGLTGLDDAGLTAAMITRPRDWSEVRPEWGLDNNAAIGRQADVAELEDNQWVLLYRYAKDGFERYDAGRWRAVTAW